MEQERNDSPFAREFVKASGLLHLLRFGRFPNSSDNDTDTSGVVCTSPDDKKGGSHEKELD